jgi:hypothetical protein
VWHGRESSPLASYPATSKRETGLTPCA